MTIQPAMQPSHPLTAEVFRLAARAAQLSERLGQPQAAAAIRGEAAQVHGGAATVVVVGEKKRGKSSLLNGLVGRPDLLPVDVDIATSTYVTVGHAEQEAATVFDEQDPGGRPIPLDDVPRYAALDPLSGQPFQPGVHHVEVGLPDPLLAAGLELVDTPGVGGLVSGHAAITLAALARADGLVFVVDGSSELTASELTFLERATERISTVFFALTQVDKYPDWRRTLLRSQELVGQHAPRFGDALWFPVSSRYKSDADRARAAGDEETARRLLERSGFFPLVAALRSRVAERAEAIRLANVAGVARAILRRQAAVQKERGLGEGPGQVPGLEASRDVLRQMLAPSSPWRQTLTTSFDELDATLRGDLDRLAGDLSTAAAGRIEMAGTNALEVAMADVDAGVEGLWMEMQNRLQDGIARVVVQLCEQCDVPGVDGLGEDLAYPDPERPRQLPMLIDEPPAEQVNIVHVFQRAWPVYRGADTPVRIMIMAGIGVGVLLHLHRRHQEAVHRAKGNAQRYLHQQLREARADIPPAVRAALQRVGAALEAHVSGQLAARLEQLQATLATARHAEEPPSAVQAAEVEAQLAELHDAIATADSLRAGLLVEADERSSVPTP